MLRDDDTLRIGSFISSGVWIGIEESSSWVGGAVGEEDATACDGLGVLGVDGEADNALGGLPPLGDIYRFSLIHFDITFILGKLIG